MMENYRILSNLPRRKSEKMSEETCYEKIRSGNVAVFEAVFREFYPSMCVVARKYLTDKEVAESIAQEAFVRLWERREFYESIPDLRTFLYVSVRNLCFNYLRDRKKTVDYTQVELPDGGVTFSELLIQEETYRLISKAIVALPRQSGNIMRLILEGKQNKEISEILGISVTTVKTLKYNALKMLKTMLKGYFPLLFFILYSKK